MDNGAKTKTSGRKKVSILLLLLLILGLISAVLLASVIYGMSKKKKQNTIPIDDDTTSSVVSDGDEDDKKDTGYFTILHSEQIFCASYKNGSGEITVLSGDGRKVIAPGTAWDYDFSVYNAKPFTLRYTLRMEAVVKGLDGEYTFPVRSRLKGPNGWLTGDGENFTPVMELNDVVDNGVLSPDTQAKYKFDWEWLFNSGNDEFDTMLGNMTADSDDITLYINIRVDAEETTDDVHGGEPVPGTGDSFSIGFCLAAMIISLFAFAAVLADSRRRYSDDV